MKSVSVCASASVSSGKKGATAVQYYPIAIPTNNSFTQQWYAWVRGKVSRHFKRNKERVTDTTQQVFLRLISKDMIGRWFYKHLTDELVDRTEAERILGLKEGDLAFIDQVKPAFEKKHPYGNRGNANSLWRIKDLLTYAKFDYERFYYSIQNHTLSSEKVLRLLGYAPDDVSALESLYRQGRLKPSELTEHECVEQVSSIPAAVPHQGFCSHADCQAENLAGPRSVSLGFCNKHSSHRKCTHLECGREHFSRGYCQTHYHQSKKRKCAACDHGRELLKARGLSLTHRWNSPESKPAAMKLRWNDSQLKPFLREWKRANQIMSKNGGGVLTPRHIMRLSPNQGIDAGLLAYAGMIVDNAVVNDFKTITRSDDVTNMVLNDGMSPEHSNEETVAWEGDGDSDTMTRVIRDTSSFSSFKDFELRLDTERLLSRADLSLDELKLVNTIDLSDTTIKEYADGSGKSVQQIHKLRNSILGKMRDAEMDVPSDVEVSEITDAVCSKHGICPRELVGPSSFGAPVAARTDLFSTLNKRGMTIAEISARFAISTEKVEAAINRASRRAQVLNA